MGSNVPKPSDPGSADKKHDAKAKGNISDKDETFGILDHAKRELSLAGLDRKDSDFDGKLAVWVIELIDVFSKQGHSGSSAQAVSDIFRQLVNWGPLSSFTDDPKEWKEETKDMLSDEQKSAGERIWQNQRVPSVFSMDAGKTWFRIDGERRKDGSLEVYKTVDHKSKEGNSDGKSTGETAKKAGNSNGNAKPKNAKANAKDSGRVQEKAEPKKPDAKNGSSGDSDKPRTSSNESGKKA